MKLDNVASLCKDQEGGQKRRHSRDTGAAGSLANPVRLGTQGVGRRSRLNEHEEFVEAIMLKLIFRVSYLDTNFPILILNNFLMLNWETKISQALNFRSSHFSDFYVL